MDQVDLRYNDNIREALQTGNIERLMELIPGMDIETAEANISKWQENYLETMQRIRNGQDTKDLDQESCDHLNSLLVGADLSGYHR